MTRVLSALYDERLGGPQLRVLQVAEQLKSRGFETFVVMPAGDSKFASLLAQAQIPFHQFNLVRLRRSFDPLEHVRYAVEFWPNVKILRQLIREHKIDIVHTNGLMNLQTPVAARLENVGLVWHLNDLGTPKPLRWMLLPLARAWAHRIALASRAVGQYCFSKMAPADERFQLLYAPVDTNKFSPGVGGANVRKELGIGAECPVVGIVANLCPGKGQEHFLEAASIIKRQRPTVKYLMVGGVLDNRREFWWALKRQTAELGLEQDVFFLGRRTDMPDVLRSMTVLVQASESEACPMAVLEASATGLPVVATRVGGTPELVEDGETGLLIGPRKPDQIAGAVLRLLDSPEMACRMGLAGAERMRKFFSLEFCVEAHLRMYEGVLSRTRSATGRHPAPQSVSTEEAPDVYSRN